MSQLFEATALVVPFEKLRMTDVESVGGKNASLGEMISQLPQGVRVPTGFATTAHAFREFLAFEGLAGKISAKLAALDVDDVRALAAVGAEIRAMVENQPFPADLEAAILRQLEAFILELGRGFAFVERQKRMVIDGEDFYLDLLFYHRRLRRLVAIELKLGRFKAAHKGQMELYLKWLDKHERQAGEEAPIGLILCAESSREQVELLQMHKDGITVAEYWTELPPKAELEQHLHQALLEARERLARRGVLLEGGEDA